MFFQLGVALSLLTDFNLKQTKISSSQTWLLIMVPKCLTIDQLILTDLKWEKENMPG